MNLEPWRREPTTRSLSAGSQRVESGGRETETLEIRGRKRSREEEEREGLFTDVGARDKKRCHSPSWPTLPLLTTSHGSAIPRVTQEGSK